MIHTTTNPDLEQENILTNRQVARINALLRRYPLITPDSPTMLTVYDTSTVMMNIDLQDGGYFIFRLWSFKTWEVAHRKLYAVIDMIEAAKGGQS